MRRIVITITFSLAYFFSIQSILANEINIYSHRQPFLIKPFLEAFTNETGIETF